MAKMLTIVIVNDAEKPLNLLARNFRSLAKFNQRRLTDVQLLVVNQDTNDGEIADLAVREGLHVEVFNPEHAIVNGVVLWDVKEALQRAFPLIKGQWFTVHHKEFICEPGAIGRIVDWLENRNGVLYLGNLRRFRSGKGRPKTDRCPVPSNSPSP